MSGINKRYAIVTTASIVNSHVNMSNSKTSNELRTSLNGLQVIVEFDGSDPLAREIFVDLQWFTHKEILTKMDISGWKTTMM